MILWEDSHSHASNIVIYISVNKSLVLETPCVFMIWRCKRDHLKFVSKPRKRFMSKNVRFIVMMEIDLTIAVEFRFKKSSNIPLFQVWNSLAFWCDFISPMSCRRSFLNPSFICVIRFYKHTYTHHIHHRSSAHQFLLLEHREVDRAHHTIISSRIIAI